MKKALLILSAFMLIGLEGCIWDHHSFCKNGRGSRVTEHFRLSDFDGIRLGLQATVFIEQGPASEIIVIAQENILDVLDLRVRNHTLVIDTDRCIWDHSEIEIFITMPEISDLIVSGSGQIIGKNTFNTANIEMLISGSGRIDLSLEAGRVESTISGSGDIILEGIADLCSHQISGSGNIHAFDLETIHTEVHISGSGNAEVWVTSYLDVKISGSGQVYYRGTPTMDLNISGSGNVIDAN